MTLFLSTLTPHRLFHGIWPDKNGRGFTELLVEQVSHHPPITAHIIEKKSKRLHLVGHNAQKISFSGTCIRNFSSFCMFIFPSQRAQSSSRKSDCLPFPLHQDLRDVLHQRRRTRLAHRKPKQKLHFWRISHLQSTVTSMPAMVGQGKRETVIDGTWHEKSHCEWRYAVKEEVSPIGGGLDGRFRNEEALGARGEGIQEE